MSDIKKYLDSKGNIMAIVIPAEYKTNGINFVTDNSAYQQIAVMVHPKDHIILPHYHNCVPRTIDYTSETLVIRDGILNVKLYENQKEIYSFDLSKGDIITLLSGGHGFTVVENVDMVEIKQGPYVGDKDKTRF